MERNLRKRSNIKQVKGKPTYGKKIGSIVECDEKRKGTFCDEEPYLRVFV